jgi:hypothetical protein
MRDSVSSIRSAPEKIREFWTKNVGFLEPILNILLKRYGLETIDLPDLKQEQKKLETSYKHQLELLQQITAGSGKRSIYVLIDKLDESEKTGASADRTYMLVSPILQDLELLGMTGYGFKIFAWDKIQDHFRERARPDRVAQYSLSWLRHRLQDLIAARVHAFSDGRIKCFSDLIDRESPFNVDAVIALFADHSPRNAIRICERIMAVQADMDNSATKLTWQAVDKGISAFAEEITSQLYGHEVCQDLKRAGRGLFTINYLASSVFKAAHENTSRNKVTAWQNCGVVKQVGTVSVVGSKRPLNFYFVSDPSMQRSINESESLEQFLKNRWLECEHCGTDNLIDISLLPSGNDALCVSCSRALL